MKQNPTKSALKFSRKCDRIWNASIRRVQTPEDISRSTHRRLLREMLDREDSRGAHGAIYSLSRNGKLDDAVLKDLPEFTDSYLDRLGKGSYEHLERESSTTDKKHPPKEKSEYFKQVLSAPVRRSFGHSIQTYWLLAQETEFQAELLKRLSEPRPGDDISAIVEIFGYMKRVSTVGQTNGSQKVKDFASAQLKKRTWKERLSQQFFEEQDDRVLDVLENLKWNLKDQSDVQELRRYILAAQKIGKFRRCSDLLYGLLIDYPEEYQKAFADLPIPRFAAHQISSHALKTLNDYGYLDGIPRPVAALLKKIRESKGLTPKEQMVLRWIIKKSGPAAIGIISSFDHSSGEGIQKMIRTELAADLASGGDALISILNLDPELRSNRKPENHYLNRIWHMVGDWSESDTAWMNSLKPHLEPQRDRLTAAPRALGQFLHRQKPQESLCGEFLVNLSRVLPAPK